MKTTILLAAAAIAVTGVVPGLTVPAAAQHRVDHRRVVHHAPPRHRACHWEQRGHHRVRVCR